MLTTNPTAPKTSFARLFRIFAEVAGGLLPLYIFILVLFYFPSNVSGIFYLLKVLAGAFILSIGAILFLKRHGIRLTEAFQFGSRRGLLFQMLGIVIAFAVGAALCYARALVRYLAPWLGLAPGNDSFDLLTQSTQDISSVFGVLWLVHSIGEELFFRGFLHKVLKLEISWLAAIVLSSAIFAIAHLQPFSMTLLLFFYGFVFALAYDFSGLLIFPIAMHASLNAWAYCMVAHFKNFYVNEIFIMGPVFLGCLILSVVMELKRSSLAASPRHSG